MARLEQPLRPFARAPPEGHEFGRRRRSPSDESADRIGRGVHPGRVTEARDTLEYLAGRIRARTGEAESVAVIHGGVPRDRRRATIAAFNDDPAVRFLVANDAAGEGVKAGRCGTRRNQAQGSPPARQLCFDFGASMPWSRMRSDPILSVSPSVTENVWHIDTGAGFPDRCRTIARIDTNPIDTVTLPTRK